MNVGDILIQYRSAFFQGLLVTFELAGSAWAFGILLGFFLGWLAHRFTNSVGRGLHVVSFFFSALPLLVLLYWAHYPLQVLLGVVINPFYTAVTILIVLNTIATAAILRTALDDFPAEFIAAARVCGLSPRTTIVRIQIPIILRQILPSLLNQQVSILQMTLFASLISVEELFRVSQRINATIYKPVEIYTALAFFFLLICLPVNVLAWYLKRRFTRNTSES